MKLAEIVDQYKDGINRVGLNWAPAGGVPLPLRAIVYAAPPSDKLFGEEDLAYKVIDLFIANGFDLNEKFGPDQVTAVQLAESLKDFDSGRCYNYLLDQAFNQPLSATEAVDLSKVKQALGKLGKMGKGQMEKVLGAVDKAIGKVTGMPGVKNRFETGNYNTNKEGVDKGLEEKGKGLDGLKSKSLGMSKLNQQFSSLPDSAKVAYCYRNLPQNLLDSPEDNTQIKEVLARKLAKEQDPFSSKLYRAIKNVQSYLGMSQKPDKSVYTLLISEKFPEINELAAGKGLESLSKTGKAFSEQLKFMAFYSKNGFDLESLKKDGRWMSAKEMRETINNSEFRSRRIPKEKDFLNTSVNKKYVQTLQSYFGIKDPALLTRVFKEANLVPEDDESMAMGKLFRAYSRIKEGENG